MQSLVVLNLGSGCPLFLYVQFRVVFMLRAIRGPGLWRGHFRDLRTGPAHCGTSCGHRHESGHFGSFSEPRVWSVSPMQLKQVLTPPIQHVFSRVPFSSETIVRTCARPRLLKAALPWPMPKPQPPAAVPGDNGCLPASLAGVSKQDLRRRRAGCT